ncbi:hypothetical protein ES703_92839 [subsurface metagenome]
MQKKNPDGWPRTLGILVLNLGIVGLEMYGVLAAWTWLDRHTGIGSWLGKIMS